MNFKKFAEDLELDVEEYLELVELFLETGKSDIQNLQAAIADNDAEKIAYAAHSIKGAAINLGFVELSEKAKNIEQKARNGDLGEIAEIAQMLDKGFYQITELAGK